VAFWLWAGLYFTAPFLVIGAWLANRRYAAPPTAGDVVLRPLERRLVVAVGLLALATGLALFLAPGTMNDLWPWPLTPLTARVIGATFCLGGAGVGVWFDPRWTSMRVMLQVEILMLVLMVGVPLADLRAPSATRPRPARSRRARPARGLGTPSCDVQPGCPTG
jgi:hypothetical protein